MKFQFIRLGGLAVLLTGLSFMASAQNKLLLQVTVSRGTCDMSFVSHPELHFAPFTPRDIRHHVFLPSVGEPAILSFPVEACRQAPVSLNNSLLLLVAGPEARGGNGSSWGNRESDLAWGVRLRYRLNGREAFLPLGPAHNQLLMKSSSGNKQRFGKGRTHDLALQPEIYAWAPHQMKMQQSVMVPLVFSLVYE
ncbi:hypothetical protein QNZ47_000762 [Enterobacter cloacae]|nr:hypothetical protein [Enterobacter cloacae]